jgi:hypothetical protein
MPQVSISPEWDVLVDTAGVRADSGPVKPGDVVTLEARALIVLCEHEEAEAEVDHSVAASLAQAVTQTMDVIPPAPDEEPSAGDAGAMGQQPRPRRTPSAGPAPSPTHIPQHDAKSGEPR